MEDKSKICPFCREEISVFARKCRYCGEKVGDPLQTELKLTVDDIGRPEKSKTIRGETFVGAYQALQAELKQKLHKETKRSLIALPRAKEVLLTLIILTVIAGLVAFGYGMVRFAKRESVNLRDAHLRAILKEANAFKMSGDAIEALRTTHKALEVNPESEPANNMLYDLRTQIRDNMEQLYRLRQYGQVIAYADQALSVEPQNTQFMMLARLAEEDSRRYSLRLAGIVRDENGNLVTAIKTYRHGVVHVSEGDTFMDMRVLSIDEKNALVSLFDDKRDVRLKVGKGGCFFESSP